MARAFSCIQCWNAGSKQPFRALPLEKKTMARWLLVPELLMRSGVGIGMPYPWNSSNWEWQWLTSLTEQNLGEDILCSPLNDMWVYKIWFALCRQVAKSRWELANALLVDALSCFISIPTLFWTRKFDSHYSESNSDDLSWHNDPKPRAKMWSDFWLHCSAQQPRMLSCFCGAVSH